jgi:hypothetical protein
VASPSVPTTGDAGSRVRETRWGTRPSLSPRNGGGMVKRQSCVGDRKQRSAELMIRILRAERSGRGGGISTASELDLVILARSWGVGADAAREWARKPGPAERWPWTVVSMAEDMGCGIVELVDFVRDVDRKAHSAAADTSHSPRRRRQAEKSQRRAANKKGKIRRWSKPTKMVIPPPAPTRRGLPPSSPVTAGRSEPRLRGAQKPPRPLDRSPEPANPNRPAGWTTTDWINSKS